jgi:integrase
MTAKTTLPAVREALPERPRGFAITDRFLRTARSQLGARREIVQFEDKTGLGVRVSATNISFIVQLPRKDRKPYRATLGFYGVLTVAQARDAVKVLAGKIALGVDLEEERRVEEAKRKAEAEAEQARRFTVRALVDLWSRNHLSGQRRDYATGAYRRVIHHFPGLLDVPAHLIDRKEVRRAVEAAREKAGEAAARNSIVSLRSAFKWALSEDLIDIDPLPGFKLPPKTGDRERVLEIDEARRIWAATSKLDWPGRGVVQLLWLTGCRRSEVAGLRWDEIKADDMVLQIPPARTKTNSGHRIPLSSAALQVIDEAKQNRIIGSAYVFTSGGWAAFRNWARVKEWLDAALDGDGAPIADWRWHDTRRTIVTFLASKGYDPVAIDLLLGHAPSKLSPTARIYQRFEHADTRREMLQVWAEALTQGPAEVVDLDRRRNQV